MMSCSLLLPLLVSSISTLTPGPRSALTPPVSGRAPPGPAPRTRPYRPCWRRPSRAPGDPRAAGSSSPVTQSDPIWVTEPTPTGVPPPTPPHS
ncbi:hypothetical protein GDO81_018928 [Engystomops pustulosus]|uniref:Secreted protein n=1 Tax=Engystomops pustulosus TaxID=76066 RepID=A0AAV6YER6_ENGPU|nr:hypothetical protein GDO81_018928 [Engystomops pustulosus]